MFLYYGSRYPKNLNEFKFTVSKAIHSENGITILNVHKYIKCTLIKNETILKTN